MPTPASDAIASSRAAPLATAGGAAVPSVRAAAIAVALAALVAAAPARAQHASDTTLYQRLGGYDAIAAMVDDFLGRFGGDTGLAPFLGGINESEGARIRQRIVDFVCASTGGPCLYLGRDMRAAHAGMGIRDADFERVVGHFRDAAAATGIPRGPAAELIAVLEALRPRIVQQ